jgi:hypothetical protein
MKNRKFFSILIITFFLISCIIGFYTPKVKSQIVDNLSYYTSLGDLGSIYPLGITIDGISVFGALDVIFGSLFILGLYFMISSRGH